MFYVYLIAVFGVIFSIFHSSFIYFLYYERKNKNKMYESAFYSFYILNAIVGQIYVITYLITLIICNIKQIEIYFTDHVIIPNINYLIRGFLQYSLILTYTIMTMERYKILSRVEWITIPWSERIIFWISFFSMTIPLILMMYRIPFEVNFYMDSFWPYFVYKNKIHGLIVSLVNLSYDTINVLICVVLSYKSVKLYQTLRQGHTTFNIQMKNDDKLFMHSIFALICLLIRFFNDFGLLIGEIFQVVDKAPEYFQLINQLLASIHCLGGSIFFIIISKTTRKSYWKFYKIYDYIKHYNVSQSSKIGIRNPKIFAVPMKQK